MVIKIGEAKTGAQTLKLGEAARMARYTAEAKDAAERAERSAALAADAQQSAAEDARRAEAAGEGGSTEIFMAKYGVTAQTELDAALHAGKQIYAQNNHTPPTVYTLDNAQFHISSSGEFSYVYTFSHFDGITLKRIQFGEGRWITLADVMLASAGDIPSLTPYRTAAAQDEIDQARDAQIAEAKDTLTDYDGLVYAGKPENNEIIFTSADVSANDTIYYSLDLASGDSEFIALEDSDNVRIGFFGRKHGHAGWLHYDGAIIIPEGFDHARFVRVNADGMSIHYICKNPSPEMIRRHLHNLLDAFNYGKEYISPGFRLRISDGAAVKSSNYSISGFYSVLPGDVITVSDFIATSGYGIGFYDVNQEFLYGRQSGADTMTIVVPDNVFYIRYTVLNANSAQIVNIYRGSEIVEKCGRLYKKKAVTFGDSITYWDGRVFTFGKENGVFAIGYQSYMRACGMEVINKGVAGYDMTEMNPVIKNTDYTGVDIVTITSGANDSKDNVPLGAIADIGSTFDTSTFYGALQDAIEYIYTQSKTIEIVLITPIKGTYYPNGKVKQEFAEAIKEVGSLYGLPVCDWYNNSGINELTFDVYINDLPESHNYMLHPTRAGYKRMADILIPFLKSIGSDEIKKTFR